MFLFKYCKFLYWLFELRILGGCFCLQIFEYEDFGYLEFFYCEMWIMKEYGKFEFWICIFFIFNNFYVIIEFLNVFLLIFYYYLGRKGEDVYVFFKDNG